MLTSNKNNMIASFLAAVAVSSVVVSETLEDGYVSYQSNGGFLGIYVTYGDVSELYDIDKGGNWYYITSSAALVHDERNRLVVKPNFQIDFFIADPNYWASDIHQVLMDIDTNNDGFIEDSEVNIYLDRIATTSSPIQPFRLLTSEEITEVLRGPDPVYVTNIADLVLEKTFEQFGITSEASKNAYIRANLTNDDEVVDWWEAIHIRDTFYQRGSIPLQSEIMRPECLEPFFYASSSLPEGKTEFFLDDIIYNRI